MNRETCEHFTPVDLPCDKCHADELAVAYMLGYEEGMKAVLKKMEDRLKEKEARDA